MVIWITGLSGAGKTSIGRAVLELWREINPAAVLVDGDDVRRLRDRENPQDYTPAGRRAVAEDIAALCEWLNGQDVNVVCCTISSFPDLLRDNRQRFRDYFEVFVDVPVDVLAARSENDMYERAQLGKIKNVVGVDLPYRPPEHPDLVINNCDELQEFTGIAKTVLSKAQAL